MSFTSMTMQVYINFNIYIYLTTSIVQIKCLQSKPTPPQSQLVSPHSPCLTLLGRPGQTDDALMHHDLTIMRYYIED